MKKTISLYTYVDGINDAPFPNRGEQAVATTFTYTASRMGDAPSISFTLKHSLCLDDLWTDNVYAEFNGEKYYLRQTPTSAYDNTDCRYKHTVDMVSERIALNDVYFFDVVSDDVTDDKPVSNSSEVVFAGNIYEFAERLNKAIKYAGLEYKVVVPTGLSEEYKIVSFTDAFIGNVIQEIYNTYEQPYYFVGKEIHIGEYENEIQDVFEYGADKSLISITKTNANYKVVNKCTGTGSSDNIPYYYPNTTPYGKFDILLNGEKSPDITIYDWGLFAACGINGVLTRKMSSAGGEVINGYAIQDFKWKETVPMANVMGTTIYGWRAECEFVVSSATSGSTMSAYFTSTNAGVQTVFRLLDARRIELWRATGVGVIYDQAIDNGSYIAEVTIPIGVNPDTAQSYIKEYGYVSFDIRSAVETVDNWYLNDKRAVTLSALGIRYNGTPQRGDTISFVQDGDGAKMKVASQLMPSIYRENNGAERFYKAKNNTYKDEEGNYYTFENEYSNGRPREHIVSFPDIKPSIKGVTNYVGDFIDMFVEFDYDDTDNDEIDQDGNYKHPFFFAKLRKFDGKYGFNLFNHAIEGEDMIFEVTSGKCAACKWYIEVDSKTKSNTVQVDDNGDLMRDSNGNVMFGNPQERQNDTQIYEVWVALKKDVDTFGVIMPNATNKYRPSAGDAFVITNISLPIGYITSAEDRLSAAIIKYMAENNSEKFNFSIKFSRIYLAENDHIKTLLNENTKLSVKYNGKTYPLHVTSYTYKVDAGQALPEITVDLADTLSISKGALQNTINSIKGDITAVKQESTTNTRRVSERKADKGTTLADYGITDGYTRAAAATEFVSANEDSSINGVKDFKNGVSIDGSEPITYDKQTQTFKFAGNIILTGEMVMRAMLGDLDVPNIMDALVIDDETLKIINGVLQLNPDLAVGGGGGITEQDLAQYVAGVLLMYATKTYVDDAIANMPSDGGGITETELAKYLSTNKYATQTWVDQNKGIKPIKTISANTTLTASDYMVVITTTTRVTITLPTSSTAVKGQAYEIFGRNCGGMVLTANRTIYRAQGANTTSHTIAAGYFHAMVTYDGSYWLLSVTENS